MGSLLFPLYDYAGVDLHHTYPNSASDSIALLGYTRTVICKRLPIPPPQNITHQFQEYRIYTAI